jgi:hypothetical protein
MSNQQAYNVVYAGAVLSGFEEQQVRLGFVEKMNIPADKVEQLFSGRRMTLKKAISKNKAERLQQKLLTFGAETAIVPYVVEPSVNQSSDVSKNNQRENTEKVTTERSVTSALENDSNIDAETNLPKDHTSKENLSAQQQYDEDMNQRIARAQAMIEAQQIQQNSQQHNAASGSKKLTYFSVFLGALLLLLYFSLETLK